MMNEEELEDIKIKKFFKEDIIISKDANDIFESTIQSIRNENSKPKYSNNILVFRKLVAVAACVLITFVGANSYARANGYENIFFMIKKVFVEKNVSREDILSDRDITISYQSFYITEDIEMQVNKLQIIGNKAKLYLYVNEKNLNEETPFKYKVYNENGTKAYEGTSSKKENTKYNEILELKNYVERQEKLTLQVFSKESKLLKTVVIDLNERTLEARTENVEVKKISQIKLNNFLAKELESLEPKENNNKIIILKLTDISYINSNYIVKYLYTEVTDEQINNDIVEESEIKEGEAKVKFVKDEFKLVEIRK